MKKIIAQSITKSFDIGADVATVFDFLVDPINWPRFAIHNLKSAEKGKNGWYQIISKKNGPGQLKILSNKKHGLLDHIWKDAQATWNVYMRAIPNHDGTTVMITFYQPPPINAELFSLYMKEMDEEFAKLKAILEGRD